MLDLIKDYMRLSCISKPESQSAAYEFDCIIPDILPDMSKILAIDAAAVTESISRGSSNATINFKINYKILYMPDGGNTEEFSELPEIKSFSACSEHAATVSCDAIGEDSLVRAVCCVENIESNYLNSRKISIKTMIHIDSIVLNRKEEGLCTGISGLEDVQLLNSSVVLSNIVESTADTITIDEEIELSGGKAAYKDILRTDAALADVTYSVSGDKLQIKGNLEICTLYISDDTTLSVQIIENEIPFAHSTEVGTIGDDILWKADFTLKNYKTEIAQDSDGENRILHIEAEIEVSADAYLTQTLEVLNDAYSLSQKLTLEKTEMTGMLIADDIGGQFVVRDAAAKGEEQPEISQVVNVTAMIGKTSATVEDGRITAEGEIICNILYLTNNPEQPVAAFLAKLPFTQNFDSRQAKDGMTVCLGFDLNHVSFNIMSPSEIELRVSVSAKGTLIKYCDFSVICGVVQPDDPYLCDGTERPSILLYVVQLGDTLWKIAKRYNAPMDLLKEVNQLKNPDLLMPGQKLMIPR